LEGRLTHAFDRSGHTVVNLLIIFIWVKAYTKDCNPMIKHGLIQTFCPINGLSKREATELLSILFEQMVCVHSDGIPETDIRWD
jgi:hypothetical protein